VLVQLRNFTTDLETVMEAIGSFFKIEKDPFYIKGQQAATQRERAKAQIAIAKAEKEKTIEMAAKLKRKGMSANELTELTGLSIEEIAAL
jgi:predicted transposase/invertase (TIGR01784 family)